ncbi:MAG: DUF5677 domain-containing protein [Desulfobaccales bacterium]
MENDFDENGYLGGQAELWRNGTIKKYQKYFSFAYDINRIANECKFYFDFKNNQKDVVISSTLSRILSSFQAAILLCSYCLFNESEVVIRSMMEATFILVACCKDRYFYKTYINSFHAERLRVTKNIHLRNFSDFLKMNITADDFSKIKYKCEHEEINSIKVLETAQKANMEYYYYSPYWFLSLASHVSPKSAEKYIKESDGEVYLELWQEPKQGSIKEIIILGSDLLFRSFETLYEYYGKTQPYNYSRMLEQFKEIIEEDSI